MFGLFSYNNHQFIILSRTFVRFPTLIISKNTVKSRLSGYLENIFYRFSKKLLTSATHSDIIGAFRVIQ